MGEHSKSTARTVAILAFVAVALWAGIYAVLQQSRRTILDEATATRANLARSLAEYQASSVRAIDTALVFLRDAWNGDPIAFGERVGRHEALLRKEKVIQIAVVDADGWLRYSRLPQAGQINFEDRDYFREQRARTSDELHVSTPVLGRITGQWAIQFTRPLRDSRGRFAGIIVVAVPPPALEKVYDDIALGSGGVVTLARTDGIILARNAEFERTAGRTLAGNPAWQSGAAASGELLLRSSIDGADRYVSYRRIEEYPLVVYVGQKVEAVLAPYRRQVTNVIAIGAAVTALLVGLAVLVVSRARDRRRFEDEREKLMLELHDGCIQSIYAVGLTLQDCRALLKQDRARADGVIAEAEVELNLVIQELRAFITGAKRQAYSPEQFIAEIDRAIPARGPAFSLDIDRSIVGGLSVEQQDHVLRIVREAASNVLRHAEAASSSITLARLRDRVRLEIADDGRGMRGETASAEGLGVAHIHSRAKRLGGSANVTSAPDEGTRVVVEFPERP